MVFRGDLLQALVLGRNEQVDFDVGLHPNQVGHPQQPTLCREKNLRWIKRIMRCTGAFAGHGRRY